MERSRWIGLVATAVYAVLFLWPWLRADESAQTSSPTGLSLIFVILGFICTWWSEALGNALWIDRTGGAWNPKVSTEGAIKLLGYLFLIVAFGIHILLSR